MTCRNCGAVLSQTVLDLGVTPNANTFLAVEELDGPERRFPLRVMVCEKCWLVQTADVLAPNELFGPDYSYFSGYSSSWVEHCRTYAERMIHRLALNGESSVVEVATNDGVLLRFFQDAGMRCTGIEPTLATAEAARALGLSVVTEFLTGNLAARLRGGGLRADLLVANNVLAHVPEIVDFASACAVLLADDGVASFEFPHVHELLVGSQFDTVYHEHYSYLSLLAVESVFSRAGLVVFDVERLPTHGGSLRVFAQRSDSGVQTELPSVGVVRRIEEMAGLASAEAYVVLQEAAIRITDQLRRFLERAQLARRTVAAYGAAAKGNTLLNYAGIGAEQVRFVADRNPAKQGMYLPGSRVPVVAEDRILADRPDYVLILPWNLLPELRDQLEYVAEWSGSLVTAVPNLKVW